MLSFAIVSEVRTGAAVGVLLAELVVLLVLVGGGLGFGGGMGSGLTSVWGADLISVLGAGFSIKAFSKFCFIISCLFCIIEDFR